MTCTSTWYRICYSLSYTVSIYIIHIHVLFWSLSHRLSDTLSLSPCCPQVQLLISGQDVDNYKLIKSDLDRLRTMVEKSELWVDKKSSSGGGEGKKDKKDKKENVEVRARYVFSIYDKKVCNNM